MVLIGKAGNSNAWRILDGHTVSYRAVSHFPTIAIVFGDSAQDFPAIESVMPPGIVRSETVTDP